MGPGFTIFIKNPLEGNPKRVETHFGGPRRRRLSQLPDRKSTLTSQIVTIRRPFRINSPNKPARITGQNTPAIHGETSVAQNSSSVSGHFPFNVNPSATGIPTIQIAMARPIINIDISRLLLLTGRHKLPD